MKILIQGRKNGYSILYPKPTPQEFYTFASDLQSISANNYSIYYTKTFYTLAFAHIGSIFTKYIIGNDVDRGHLGEIGISIYLPNTHQLSGTDIKCLLDNLIQIYFDNYITDGYKISEPIRGFDWTKFEAEADRFTLKPRSILDETITQGTKDPAYHYYNSDTELIEHFDKPFHEDYSDYKQILFIDSKLKESGNPLDVIKNSGIEVNPDLNDKFYLTNFDPQNNVTITANGMLRTSRQGENLIRSKWPIEINFIKDSRCYLPVKKLGTISDKNTEIHQYLDIRDGDDKIKIKYDVFAPTPIQKKVSIIVKDRNGVEKDGAQITCIGNYNQSKKIVTGNLITFSGEELIQSWTVSAKIADSKGSRSIIPSEYTTVEITIEERKRINIKAQDQNGFQLDFFEVRTKHTNGFIHSTYIEFVDEQLLEEYIVTVRKEGYRDKYSVPFIPYNVNQITVTLENRQKGYDSKSEQGVNTNSRNKIKSFVGKTRIFLSKPPVIAGLCVAILSTAFALWLLSDRNKKVKSLEETSLNAQEIKAYIEGDSLLLDKLKDFSARWERREQEYITKSGGGIFGGNESIDSSRWKKNWFPVDQSIKLAINKRELINDKKLTELQKLSFSPNQQAFKNTIKKIDSTNFSQVVQKLGDITSLTLIQISDTINVILKSETTPLQNPKKQAPELNKPLNPQDKKSNSDKKNQSKTNIIQEGNASNQNTNINNNDKINSEISKYLKEDELKIETLSSYLSKTTDKKLQNSIKLALSFWNLDGTSNNSYFSYEKLLKNDENLKMSKLKNFIDEQCKNDNPRYLKQITGNKNIKTLLEFKKAISKNN